MVKLMSTARNCASWIGSRMMPRSRRVHAEEMFSSVLVPGAVLEERAECADASVDSTLATGEASSCASAVKVEEGAYYESHYASTREPMDDEAYQTNLMISEKGKQEEADERQDMRLETRLPETPAEGLSAAEVTTLPVVEHGARARISRDLPSGLSSPKSSEALLEYSSSLSQQLPPSLTLSSSLSQQMPPSLTMSSFGAFDAISFSSESTRDD